MPRSCSSRRFFGLVGFSFDCLPRSRPLALATYIPSRGAQPYQIGLELRNHPEHVEQEPSDGIGGVVNRAAEAELDVSSGQLIEDVVGI